MSKRARPAAWNKGRPLKITKVAVVKQEPQLSSTQRNQVKRIVNSKEEIKTFTKGASAASMGLVASIVALTEIPQGITDNSRIGNHVHMKSMKGAFTVVAADSTNVFRVIIFKWKENDTFNAPTLSQILAPGPTGGPDFWSVYAPENPGNYQIIRDFQMVGSNGSSHPDLIQIRKVKAKLSGKCSFYSDIGVSGTGKYFIMYFSDSSAVPNPAITYNFEFGFLDS